MAPLDHPPAPAASSNPSASRAEEAEDAAIRSDHAFLGHPRGLATLFGLELWERFSYLGFQAILALYFADTIARGGMGFEQATASSLVAAYGGLVYLLTVIGGWVADRLIGMYRSVLWGGIIIAAGHILMGIPAAATTWAGLGTIILGTGLLKPNVSSMVGRLYTSDDERRDAGFAIYYAGINIGAFLGQFVVGFLGQSIGWHWGFGAAAVGMILGIGQYVLGRRHLAGRHHGADRPIAPEHRVRALGLMGAAVVVVVAVGVVFSTATNSGLDGWVNLISVLTMIAPIVFFTVMFRSRQVTTQERRHLSPFLVLFGASVLFNMILFQSGNTLNFLALDHARNEAFGLAYPSTWYASFMPIVEIVAGPVLAVLWVRLGRRQPQVSHKVALGVIFGGLSFLLLVPPTIGVGGDWRISGAWLLGVYLLIGVGDVLLQTAGMSATTKLAPAAFASQTMALWFLAMALAQGLQAQVVKFYGEVPMPVYFGVTGAIAVAYGVVMLVAGPWLRRRMHPVV